MLLAMHPKNMSGIGQASNLLKDFSIPFPKFKGCFMNFSMFSFAFSLKFQFWNLLFSRAGKKTCSFLFFSIIPVAFSMEPLRILSFKYARNWAFDTYSFSPILRNISLMAPSLKTLIACETFWRPSIKSSASSLSNNCHESRSLFSPIKVSNRRSVQLFNEERNPTREL